MPGIDTTIANHNEAQLTVHCVVVLDRPMQTRRGTRWRAHQARLSLSHSLESATSQAITISLVGKRTKPGYPLTRWRAHQTRLPSHSLESTPNQATLSLVGERTKPGYHSLTRWRAHQARLSLSHSLESVPSQAIALSLIGERTKPGYHSLTRLRAHQARLPSHSLESAPNQATLSLVGERTNSAYHYLTHW